jgi:hypothetical protein
MADRCPHCDAALLTPLPGVCPACQKSLGPTDTGITATPAPVVDGSFAEGAPPETPPVPRFDEDAPSIVKAEATGPSCPAWLLAGLSAFLCASQGAMANFGKPGGFSFKSEESAFGGIVGLVIGLALAVDHWLFQKKLNKPAKIPGEDGGELPDPVPPPNEWMPLAMLILPVVAGVLMWFASPLRLTETYVALIGSGAVVATAVLGYFSIRQMALRVDRTVSYHGALSNPAFTYLAMLFLWIILYPIHFVIRWRMGGKNLIIPGLIATAVYCSQIAQPFLVDAELPPVDDAEVLTLVRQMVEDEPMMKPATIRNPVEVSFDLALQKRIGRCTINTKFGEEPVSYTIDWQDRKQRIWQVHVLDRLPFVDAPEVLNFVKDLLHGGLWDNGRIRLDPVVLRNPVQTGYDAARQRRTGRVSASAGRGEANVTYVITWADADRKLFNVQVNGKVP